MNHFTLYPHCYVAQGEKKAAIYDILQKRLIWLEEPWKGAALNLTREGASIQQAAERLSCSLAGTQGFFTWLQEMEVGILTATPQASVKFKPFFTAFSRNKSGVTRPLGRVMLELTSECPLNCSFCRPGTRIAAMECMCGRYSDARHISYNISETIARLSVMRPAMLDLMGGDPLANVKDVCEILDGAAQHGIPVTLRTSGCLANEEVFNRLKQADATMVVNLVNLNPQVEDEQLALLLRLLKLSKASQYNNLQFAPLFGEQHKERASQVARWLAQFGVVQAPVIFFQGKGESLPKTSLSPQAPAEYAVGIDEAVRVLGGHPCWQDSLCIMANGDVRRCIAAENTRFGNVKDENILDILRHMHNPENEPEPLAANVECGKCEFFLGCFGCEVTRDKIGAGGDKRAWNCAYQPLEGRFGS